MRIRTAVVVSLIALPAALSAQRIPPPRLGDRRPATPTDLPPQIAPVARAVAFQRSHVSFESYPILSYVNAPGYGPGAMSHWTTLGVGTRTEYRVRRNLSATFDVTSSFLGGPGYTYTAELGTRVSPMRNERRVYPFLDVRAAYLRAVRGDAPTYVDPYGYSGYYYNARYSDGFGAVGGAGAEYALTRSFSLVSGASVLRSSMQAYGLQNAFVRSHYMLTSYRFVIALRYNPVHVLTTN
ncbi:MAG TPA: hypothetical protein VKH19_02235 [Gemmatimonadaceae bacterium]|nr:hypothetical protein [Gemmatimonadaceae bacterium]